MKICKTCNQELSLNHFYKHKRNLDGYYGDCKSCRLSKQKKYYIEHKCTPEQRLIQKQRNLNYRTLCKNKNNKQILKH